jgi:hypothetical protein
LKNDPFLKVSKIWCGLFPAAIKAPAMAPALVPEITSGFIPFSKALQLRPNAQTRVFRRHLKPGLFYIFHIQ